MNRTIIFTLTSVIGLGACTASASNDAPAAKATPSTMVNDVAYTPVCHRVSPAFKEAISSALTESYKDASVGDGFYIRTGATIGPRVPRPIYESAVEIRRHHGGLSATTSPSLRTPASRPIELSRRTRGQTR